MYATQVIDYGFIYATHIPLKNGWIYLGSYYQLVSSVGNYKEIVRKSRERSLCPSEVEAESKGGLLALQMSPENLDRFDESVEDLDIRYFLFSNKDFKSLIKFSQKLNMRIRGIETKEIDEDLREEMNEYIENREYDNLVKFIDENHICIKALDLFFNGNIIKIYDSGIFWTDVDLLISKLTPLLKSIGETLRI